MLVSIYYKDHSKKQVHGHAIFLFFLGQFLVLSGNSIRVECSHEWWLHDCTKRTGTGYTHTEFSRGIFDFWPHGRHKSPGETPGLSYLNFIAFCLGFITLNFCQNESPLRGEHYCNIENPGSPVHTGFFIRVSFEKWLSQQNVWEWENGEVKKMYGKTRYGKFPYQSIRVLGIPTFRYGDFPDLFYPRIFPIRNSGSRSSGRNYPGQNPGHPKHEFVWESEKN